VREIFGRHTNVQMYVLFCDIYINICIFHCVDKKIIYVDAFAFQKAKKWRSFSFICSSTGVKYIMEEWKVKKKRKLYSLYFYILYLNYCVICVLLS